MEIDPNMEKLADALILASDAYRNVANDQMGDAYGSIDKIYDCVRNSRNLSNKSRKVRQYGSVY
jgi:hypothetical protein